MIKQYRYVIYLCILLIIVIFFNMKLVDRQIDNIYQTEFDVALNSKSEKEIETDSMRIRISFEGKEIILMLHDSITTQTLLKQLPIRIYMEDYVGKEKIIYFPESLSQVDDEGAIDPQIGDVACYRPWGNLVLYYVDQPYANGITTLGKIESGLQHIVSIKESVQVYIEQL